MFYKKLLGMVAQNIIFRTNLTFNGNIISDTGVDSSNWYSVGGVTFINNVAEFSENSYLKDTNENVLRFYTNDFSMEMLVNPINIGNEYRILLSGENTSAWTSASQIFIRNTGSSSKFGVELNIGSDKYTLTTLENSVVYNTENKLRIERIGESLSIYLNDIKHNYISIPSNTLISFNQNGIRIGTASWDESSFYTGSLTYLRAWLL